MIFSLFRKNDHDRKARDLYVRIIEQARNPHFFVALGAPDTVEGRFEVLALHMHLVLRRLKGVDDAFAQKLFDVFFTNMDDSLRELGVGDMSIGRKVRGLAEAFYGRIGAYEAGLAEDDDAALTEAIARNVFENVDAPGAPALAGYTRVAASKIDAQDPKAIINGAIAFPDPASASANKGAAS